MSHSAAWPAPRALAWAARHERLLVVASLVPLLGLFAALYLPLLPNEQGSLPADFALWLPDLLVGDYWFATNGLSALPWFSPAECAGVPYFADPQVPYFSLAQALSLVVSPMTAVQVTILAAAGAGFLGAYALARLPFRASPAAAGLAGVLFMFNLFYATRMLVGHLPYYPFMLLPTLLLAVLPWGERRGAASEVLRVGSAALLVAAMVEAGMVQLVVPAALTGAFVLLLAGATVGWSWRAAARLGAAAALGAALSAGKLAAAFALLAHYPRDLYVLPGFRGLWNAVWQPVQMLFLGPPPDLQEVFGADWSQTGHNIRYDQHEFVYTVTPVPALLLAAAALAWLLRGHWRRPGPGRLACAAGMLLLVVVPVAANFYAPGWSAWLKTLPLLHNSSILTRWFASWMLPAILGAALALDRLAGRHGTIVAVPLAVASALLALVWVARADLSYYEDHGYGASAFPIAPIGQGWAALHAGAAVPSSHQPDWRGRAGVRRLVHRRAVATQLLLADLRLLARGHAPRHAAPGRRAGGRRRPAEPAQPGLRRVPRAERVPPRRPIPRRGPAGRPRRC